MRSSVCITLLFLAAVLANEDDLRRIDSIVPEEPCNRVGGICVLAADCPESSLAETPGLCPRQQRQGVECCYGISRRETRCEKHGGMCMAPDLFCNPNLIVRDVTDCPRNHKCCVLVR